MTIRRYFTLSLMVSALAASWVLPAAATDLNLPPPASHKAAPAKKAVRHWPTRVAAAWSTAPACGLRCASLLMLGVAY